MKRRPLQWNVVRDDGGQAMTEFVIVIPIILLFFFAMLQYFATVQASQLANYAAFESARVYAVRASVDAKDAQSKALMAASMVMAPVASPMPGEIPAVGADLSMANSTLSQYIPAGMVKYFEGLAFAYFVRFQVLGGSVSNTINGNQVDCTINYPQPIYVPGLSAMWNFLSADKTKTINTDTASLENGLGGLVKGQQTINQLQTEAGSAVSEFNSIFGTSISIPNIPQVLLPYVNIQAKCSLGYSAWSGTPRLPDNETDTSGVTNSPGDNLQKVANDNNAYSNACAVAKQDCMSVTQACSTVQSDQSKVAQAQSVVDNAKPKPTQAQLDALSAAQAQLKKDQDALTAAKQKLAGDQGAVNSTAGPVNDDNTQLNTALKQQDPSAKPIGPVPTSIDCPACN
jgi:hypothetical protein